MEQTLFKDGTNVMIEHQSFVGIALGGRFAPTGIGAPRAVRPMIMQT